MPRLPRIEPPTDSIPVPEAPHVNASVYGADVYGQLADTGEMLGRLQDGADRAEATKLTADAQANFKDILSTNRDNITDPNEFSQTTTQQLQDTHDAAVDAASNPRVKKLVGNSLSNDLILSQTQLKHDTFQKTKDQALANADAAFDIYSKAAASGDEQTAKQAYQQYGDLLGTLKGHGFYSAKEAQDKLMNFDRTVTVNYASGLINTGNFAKYDQDRAAGKFSNLTETQQLELDKRVDAAYKRQENDVYGANQAADDAWMNKNLDAILQNKGAAGTVNDFIDQNKQWIKAADVIYMRKKIVSLLGPDGKSSAAKDGVLADYENERLGLGGLTTQDLATKYSKAIDAAGLDATSTREAKQQITNDLERANQIRQGQAAQARAVESYGRAVQNYQDRQQDQAAKQALADAFDPTKLTPDQKKQIQGKIIQGSFGGTNLAHDQNTILESAIAEHNQTGENAALIVKRKVADYFKNILPKTQPVLSPEEKIFKDMADKLRINAGPK